MFAFGSWNIAAGKKATAILYPTSVTITSPADGESSVEGSELQIQWTVDQGSNSGIVYATTTGSTVYGSGDGQAFITTPSVGTNLSFYVQCGGVSSSPVTIYSIPNSITLTSPSDGSNFTSGDSVRFYWSVGGGSDYADLYIDGLLVGSGNGGSGVSATLSGSSGGSSFSVYVTNGTLTSGTIYVYTYPTEPTSVTITSPADGTGYVDGDTATIYWSVDYGSSYGTVYVNGSPVATGNSGEVFITLSGSMINSYDVYVVCGSATSSTINLVTT